MSKRLLFIANPRSGKGQIKDHLADILDIMIKAGYQVSVHITQSGGDATDQTIAQAENFDRIVCSGGDGTLDEVVTGMMKLEPSQRKPIGYIPAGSTNDFGNSLGIDKNMLNAARMSVSDNLFPCDIGRFNSDSFVYVAAFGLFTEVSYATPQDMKNILGHAAYIIEGAKQLRDIPSFRMQVEYDGNVIYDEFIFGMITNSKSVGGFQGIIRGDIGLNDGVFEVTLIKMPRNPIELNEILGFMTGIISDSDMVYAFQTEEIKFLSSDVVPWTLDGEFGGKHDVVVIKDESHAVEIAIE
ncbi:diacylglycerol/lipid kinase family protein [Pseudobutyrivibrio xylanivorans]|uniref:Lipid kinase, YegS/Rv2252/BmrU family n=1 Tax=Pseudobutyrivibrio xylanivorans DSM 14809 TaxID=1123012 RepID=A0A1M6F3K7_PSEXY|nr:YegS/Rv2252/BmrU family lipid kinase [Pseudobutyrivibrio xylanivorans]SHI92209.1 lipid kinase, YegS/Rv2252/BmrU family [Pseudobutyrivibrio xylanivorans DSM 14809]